MKAGTKLRHRCIRCDRRYAYLDTLIKHQRSHAVADETLVKMGLKR